MHKVSELMSGNVQTLRESSTIQEARRIMDLNFIRHIPVVNSQGRLCGLVTQKDVLAASHKPLDTQLREIMATEVATVTPEFPLRGAAETMIYNKYGCLPVVSEDKVVGIITETDFVKLVIFPIGGRSAC